MIKKVQVLQSVLNSLNIKLAETMKELQFVQESANSETKSSAGDKYETGRAQAQIEIDKLRVGKMQLEGHIQLCQKAEMDHIVSPRIGFNSIAETTEGTFYLLLNYGKLTMEEKTIFVISTEAPLAKLLLHKQVGEAVQFPNGKTATILRIY